MNRTAQIIIGIIVLLAVAGGSFYGGTLYGKSQAQTTFAARRQGAFPGAGQNGQLPGQPGGTARTAGQGGVFGTIKQIGDGVLVIADNNGKETQVKVTDTTLIEKQASVKLADLAAGEMVIISGSTAADGSITARSVQVAPAGRFGAGAPGAAPGATPAP